LGGRLFLGGWAKGGIFTEEREELGLLGRKVLGETGSFKV